MIAEEGKSKGPEETIKIYEKWFLKKEYAHGALNKMMKRIKKHLQDQDKDCLKTLLNKCYEKLTTIMEERIHAVLPNKDLKPWPDAPKLK